MKEGVQCMLEKHSARKAARLKFTVDNADRPTPETQTLLRSDPWVTNGRRGTKEAKKREGKN